MADAVVPNDRSEAARYVLAVRRMIQDAIAEDIVHNPAVDMLFTLFLAPDDGWLTAAEVCEGSAVSEEGCRRWGAVLIDRHLVVIQDGRYRLSDRGRTTMDEINEAVWSLADQHLRPSFASR